MYANTIITAAATALLSATALANPTPAAKTCGQLQMWTHAQGESNVCGPNAPLHPVFDQPSGPTGCQHVPDQTSVMWLNNEAPGTDPLAGPNAKIAWYYDAACTRVNLAPAAAQCVGSFGDENYNNGQGWWYKITC